MLKKRLKPLKPTLRVQTDFYDTLHHKREEKRLEQLQRGMFFEAKKYLRNY